MQALENTVRTLRVIHVALLSSILLYAFVGELLKRPEPFDTRIVFPVLLIVAVAQVGGVLFFRSRMVGPAADALRIRPDDTAELNRWRIGSIGSFALCEAIGLFGLVLRILGGTLEQAVPFYGAALFLLLIYFPRNPANA